MREWLPTTVTGDLTASTANTAASNTANTTQPQASASTNTDVAAKKSEKKAGTKTAGTALTDASGQVSAENLSSFAGITIKVARHLGGIMIAGPSREVFVCQNQIEGGRFNGITLGSYSIVDGNGLETSTTVGVTTVQEDPCSTTGTLEPPSSSTTGTQGTSIVAGGLLLDIVIDRNRISNMGLCGIGPVGLFDLVRIFEIISIENLTITNNIIRNTVLRSTAALNTFGSHASQETYTFNSQNTSADSEADPGGFAASGASFSSVQPITSGAASPYAAVCVPAVENLVIRDNAITNFGATPGVGANGIFVLNGEMVDISRNQVLETRDWNAVALEAAYTVALCWRSSLLPCSRTHPRRRECMRVGAPLPAKIPLAAGSTSRACRRFVLKRTLCVWRSGMGLRPSALGRSPSPTITSPAEAWCAGAACRWRRLY
jgi:hypothetical protein